MSQRFLAFWMLVAVSSASAQSAFDTYGKLRAQAREAYVRKDYAAAQPLLERLYQFSNGSSRSVYNLASVAAAQGDKEQALKWLSIFADMGQAMDLRRDPGFKSLESDARFKELTSRMQQNQRAINHGTVAFTVPDPELLTEDIAYDPKNRNFYVSSIRGHKIIRIDASGHTSDFITGDDSFCALRLDPDRRVLWATTTALKGYAFAPKKDWGKSELLEYDLQSRRVLARFSLPDNKQSHTLGDMTLTPSGDLVVSDGEAGGVYLLRHGARQFEKLSDEFVAPQTPAMHPDERHVFVPDYARGIGVLNLRTHHVEWLRHVENVAINGIDGLYFHDRALLAVQNGTSPERVIRIELTPALDAVAKLDVIQTNTNHFGDPTHGVIVGNDFYCITNSGWDAFDDYGQLKPGEKLTNPVVMKFSLAH
jgi:sugar lactone lactonase YvrE